MPEEDQDHDADNDHFHDQLMLQRVDGSINQFGAIIGVDDLYTLGKRRLKFLQLCLLPA